MTTKVKVGISWISSRLPAVIEYHRLHKTYASTQVVIKKGWWKKECIECPISDSDEYWEIMQTFYPWNCLRDTKHLLQHPKSTVLLYVDAALVNAIMEVEGGADE